MTSTDEGPDNLVLRYLRDISARIERMDERIDLLTQRVAGIEKVVGIMVTQVNLLNERMDKFEVRMARIERRLELADVQP